jgi:hypothetical protein
MMEVYCNDPSHGRWSRYILDRDQDGVWRAAGLFPPLPIWHLGTKEKRSDQAGTFLL